MSNPSICPAPDPTRATARRRAGRGARILLGALLLGAGGVVAAPPAVTEQPIILLHVDVLGIRPERTETLATGTLELLPGSRESLEFKIAWPRRQSRRRLSLDAGGRVGEADRPHRVSVRTRLRVDGREVAAARDLEMSEASTYFMEAYELEGQRLVVALRAESASRPVVVAERTVGPPVRFRLVVERVDGPRVVPLETNRLHTFLGQGVEYSFRRNVGEAEESVRLRLRPVRIRGEVAELEVEIEGSLPGEPERLVLSRRDTVLTTKGATSTVVVATGEPPSGYRFLITPDFF